MKNLERKVKYKIVFERKARKELRTIPQNFKDKINKTLVIVSTDPYYGKKLEGKLKDHYSFRVWPYRVIYIIEKEQKSIIILHVAHRQGVYGLLRDGDEEDYITIKN